MGKLRCESSSAMPCSSMSLPAFPIATKVGLGIEMLLPFTGAIQAVLSTFDSIFLASQHDAAELPVEVYLSTAAREHPNRLGMSI